MLFSIPFFVLVVFLYVCVSLGWVNQFMKASDVTFFFRKKESNQRKKPRLGYLLRMVCALAGTVVPEDSLGRI